MTSEENNQSLTPEAEDCASGSVPHDVKSKSGTKKIRLPELVSMWKYMMRGKRLVLYSFLNNCLRNGELGEAVGFDVTNSVINKEACEFTGVTFWKIDRESFYADVNVRLKLKSGRSRRVWNGILVCCCCFGQEFHLSVESLIKNTNRKEECLTMLSPFLIPYYTNQRMDELGEQIWTDYGMPEAISDPGIRNAVEFAESMGLTFRYLKVYEHKDMESIVFFADSDLLVGEDRIEKLPDGKEKRIKTNAPVIERIAANTIVVNTNKVTEKEMDELDAKMEYQETFPRTFHDAFDMLMRKNGETRETIAPKLYIAERTLFNWVKTPDRKITPDFVIYISLMWQIPDWISKMLLDRAMIRLSEFDRRHQALEYIRTVLWDQGVDEANKYLISKGLEPLKL